MDDLLRYVYKVCVCMHVCQGLYDVIIEDGIVPLHCCYRAAADYTIQTLL